MDRRALQQLWSGVFACVLAGACSGDGGSASERDDVGVVESITDGDTINVEIQGRRERVRLLGIDTPEVEHDGEPGECFGAEASARAGELVPTGTQVRLERDVVARDDYGRLLAYIFTDGSNRSVNERLVAEGFATPLFIEPNGAYRRRIVAAAHAAQSSRLGLWSSCGN